MKSPRNIKITTIAAFDEQEKQALAVLENIRKGREQAAQEQTAKLSAYLGSIPDAIGKLTGKTGIGIADVINLLKQQEKGTLGKVGVTVGAGANHGQHAKRLSDAEELSVKEAFMGRAVSEALGQPQKTVSAICTELNISGQTYDVRRKKYMADAEVTAEIARRAAAMKPAAPALAAV